MTSSLQLRTARPDDAAAIERVLNASYPRLMASAYEAAVLAAALPAITRAHPALLTCGTYYVAVTADQAVVACGGWTPTPPGAGRTEPGLAHLRHFATDGDWVGQGIGRRIYQRCETAARDAGMSVFECYASLNAVPFYAALGFAAVERVDAPLRNGARLPSLLMRRAV